MTVHYMNISDHSDIGPSVILRWCQGTNIASVPAPTVCFRGTEW